MALLNFMDTIEVLAFHFEGNEEHHHRFVSDAKLIVDALLDQLQKNKSIFPKYMKELRKTSSFVSDIYLDMPLYFEVFLTMRLPLSLTPAFNKTDRSVKLIKVNCTHPFFFGNEASAASMNILMQRDLMHAISEMDSIDGYWGAIYDLKYNTLSHNRIPFTHQLFAKERGAAQRGIRFDFILALEFDGAELPLPAYFKAPINYKWLAYGLIKKDECQTTTNWGVILPTCQNASMGCLIRVHNTLLLLHRLMYANQCFYFAMPFLLKFGFFMTTMDHGERYKRKRVAELLIATLGHLVFRNYSDLTVDTVPGMPSTRMDAFEALRGQQLRGKGLFALLCRARQLNLISSEFIVEYFQVNYKANMQNMSAAAMIAAAMAAASEAAQASAAAAQAEAAEVAKQSVKRKEKESQKTR